MLFYYCWIFKNICYIHFAVCLFHFKCWISFEEAIWKLQMDAISSVISWPELCLSFFFFLIDCIQKYPFFWPLMSLQKLNLILLHNDDVDDTFVFNSSQQFFFVMLFIEFCSSCCYLYIFITDDAWDCFSWPLFCFLLIFHWLLLILFFFLFLHGFCLVAAVVDDDDGIHE